MSKLRNHILPKRNHILPLLSLFQSNNFFFIEHIILKLYHMFILKIAKKATVPLKNLPIL